MRLWVFSDLHLTTPQDPLYSAFIKTLDEPQTTQDCVVYAGDIFDLYVGNKREFALIHARFFEQVKRLHERNVQQYYIEGNHDFQLSDVLSGTGVQLIENEIVLTVPENRKKIYIAHGDLVNTLDTGYLKLRAFFRSAPVQALINVLPAFLILKIAQQLSRPPERQQAELPEKWPSDEREQLRKIYREFARQKTSGPEKVDYVILGHCHDLDEVLPFYRNMGYPPVHRQYLFYDSQEDCVNRRFFTGI